MVTGASRGLGLRVVESLVAGNSDPDKIIIATARNPSGAQVNKHMRKCYTSCFERILGYSIVTALDWVYKRGNRLCCFITLVSEVTSTTVRVLGR
jgi:NAD(P)-dependent dehydrogenase (short-subunit alcohol dehydrogenase family)